MKNRPGMNRVLLWTGLICMLIGAIDPLEGSAVIVIGAGLALLGTRLGKSRHWKMPAWGFGLIALGVGILFGMSAIGGIGGSTGRSMWWALTILPYPAGWVVGLVGAVKAIREKSFY
ncbi:hypothetical protein JW777_08020 [bacterium]|nr:hypothetical protein [bacterium]